MSVYTTELRMICESYSGLEIGVGYNDVDAVIENSWEKIFKKFPIFNETYRSILCKKIIGHYYTREIGAETVGLWKMWLNQRMFEIMPYYNKLYESEMLNFDPLNEIDFTKTTSERTTSDRSGTESATGNVSSKISSNEETTQSGNSESKITATSSNSASDTGTITDNNTTNSKSRHSDTPQGSLANIENNSYLTDATITDTIGTNTKTNDLTHTENDTSDSTSTNTTGSSGNKSFNEKNESAREDSTQHNETANGNRDITETYRGKNSGRSYASLISEYRESLLNIDLQIILELRDLFINIY